MNVLLIESDAAFANTLAQALEPEGVAVTTVGDGNSGLDQARRDRPDAIVLSVELPEVSGFALCSRLRRAEDLSGIPVILISAEASPEAFEQHRKNKARADAYLHKPFDASVLLAHVKALTGVDPEAIAGLTRPPQNGSSAPAAGAEVVTLDEVAADLDLEFRSAGEPLHSSRPPPLPRPGPPPLSRPKAIEVAELPDPFGQLPTLRVPPGATADEKLQVFRDRIKQLESAIAAAREAFTQLHGQIAAVRGEAEGWQHRADAYAAQVEERRTEIAELEARLIEEEAAREELEGQVMEARGEAALKDDELNEHLATLAQVEDELVRNGRGHAESLEKAEKARQDLSEILNETISEREEEARQTSARIAEAEGRSAELQQSLEAAQVDFGVRLIQAREEAETRVAELVEGYETRLASLAGEHEAQLAELRGEYEGMLEAERARADETITEARRELEDQVAAVRQSYEAHLSEVQYGAEQALAAERAQSEATRQEVESSIATHREWAESEIRARQDTVTALEQMLEEQRERVASERADREALRATLEGEKAALTEALGQSDADLAERAEALLAADARASALEEELGQRVQDLEARTFEIEDAWRRIGTLEGALASRDSEVEVRDAALLAARGHIASLEERLSALSLELNQVRRAADTGATDLEAQLGELQSALQSTQGEAEGMRLQLEQAREELDEVEGRLMDRDGELAEARGEADAREMELEALRAQLGESQSQIAALQAAVRRGQASGATADASTEALKQEVARAHTEARKAIDLLKQERALRKEAVDKLGVYRTELKKAREAGAETGTLKAAVEKLNADLEEMRDENDFLNGEVSRLSGLDD